MTPYSSFFYFYLMAIVLLPAIVLGLLGKKLKWYGFAANLVMLYVIFAHSNLGFRYLIGFYGIQLVLVKGYVWIRSRYDNRWILWVFTLLSILPLMISKASGTFSKSQIGFLGISYLTFKTVQILLETFDGLIKNIGIVDFSYFLLFFPTISSGPIDRSRRFIKDAERKLSRSEYLAYLGDGIYKIMQGILYKFIIGYFINTYWLEKIPTVAHGLAATVSYMYAYSLYLFFDFGGYSLLAVGASYILGIRTPDNFNLPFISKDMKDFWNRWHMSLSFWFRDFVYTRFVMASMRKKWFKSKYTASYIGYAITMGLMGIWHGTELHYIAYGFYQAALIVLTDYYQRKKWYRKIKGNAYYQFGSMVVTFHLICFGFLIFSGRLFN